MKLQHTLIIFTLSAGLSQAATSIYRNAVLADSPIAYWEFDETSGTNAADSSVNSFNGTYETGHTLATSSAAANLGTAVDFSGGYVSLGSHDLGSLAAYTVEAWINLDSVAGFSSLIATSATGAGSMAFNISDGKIDFSNGWGVQSGANTIAVDTWYHVAVTKAGTSATIYINGSEVANGSVGAGPDSFSNFNIGAWGTSRKVDGTMDEVAIYNTALSDTRIAAHYAAASVPEPSSAALLGLGGLALILRRRK